MFPANIWSSMRNYYERGGFVNGLNPTIVGNIWYVNGEGADYDGLDGHGGRSPQDAFATIAYALTKIASYDIIVLSGVFREQVVAPTNIYDVTILGAGNRTRQATDGGVATGGGATWMAPASPVATTPLIQIIRQGWTIENVMFNPVTNSAAVRLTTSGGLNEAGQFTFRNNLVMGGGTGQIGIEDNGGSGFVVVEGSEFQGLTGTALLGLSTSNAVPLSWRIENNKFQQNTNDIKMSLSYAQILGNRFLTAGAGATNKVISTTFLSTQGGNNQVLLNFFNNTEAQIAPGTGYTGASTDLWQNYVNDQAALAFGQPA